MRFCCSFLYGRCDVHAACEYFHLPDAEALIMLDKPEGVGHGCRLRAARAQVVCSALELYQPNLSYSHLANPLGPNPQYKVNDPMLGFWQ